MKNSALFPLRIGLFSIGLEAYWPQFAGLRERLLQYNRHIEQSLQRNDLQVVNLGLVDTPEKALAAGHHLRQADVDLIFLHVATYALSSTVLPVVRRAKCPVIILNLAPAAAMDYPTLNRMADRGQMTGEWLAWCQACSVPEIANVFGRCRIPFFQVTGMLHDDSTAWVEIADWIDAARVIHALEHNRLGLLGHYYSGMLDIYTDLTGQSATWGGHVELLEVDELAALRGRIDEAAVEDRVQTFQREFDVQPECSRAELEQAARTSIALDALVDEHALDSLAYYYQGAPNSANEEAIRSIILGASRLTARGIPVAGEYEVKNVHAMKMMDLLGAGGSFSEFYGVDFADDVVLLGHDGPGHLRIAEGKVKVRPLGVYHGKVGSGLSVEMSVKNGPVTVLSVLQGRHGESMLLAEGESVAGPILEIGNTNSRYRFPVGARRFLNDWNAHGPAHHCAIGVGHIARKLQYVARLAGLEAAQVC